MTLREQTLLHFRFWRTSCTKLGQGTHKSFIFDGSLARIGGPETSRATLSSLWACRIALVGAVRIWDRLRNPEPLVTLGMSDRSRWRVRIWDRSRSAGSLSLARCEFEIARATLSFWSLWACRIAPAVAQWRSGHVYSQGDLGAEILKWMVFYRDFAQRSWQEMSCRDLVQRDLLDILYRDLAKRSLREIFPTKLFWSASKEISSRDLAKRPLIDLIGSL